MATLTATGDTILLDNFSTAGSTLLSAGRTPEDVATLGTFNVNSYGRVTGGYAAPILGSAEYVRLQLTATEPALAGGWEVKFILRTPATVAATMNYRRTLSFSMDAFGPAGAGSIECELWYYSPENYTPSGFKFEFSAWTSAVPDPFSLGATYMYEAPTLAPSTDYVVTFKLSDLGRFQALVDDVSYIDITGNASALNYLATSPFQWTRIDVDASVLLAGGYGLASSLDAMRIDGMAPVLPPPPFWTNFIGTYETI